MRAALLVVIAWACIEAALAQRPDFDDHGRWAASLSSTEARNFVRYGVGARGGAPLAQGGALELAREAPYLSQPVGDGMLLAGWFRVFGVSVRAARARTVTVGVLALLALAIVSRSALLPLVFGSIPIVVYYAHAAFPPFVAAASLTIAAAARFARLEGRGRGALAVQLLALAVAMGTSWKGILFAGVWLLSDLRARRRDGVIVFVCALSLLTVALAFVFSTGQVGEIVEKLRLRTGSASWLRVIRYGRGLGYGPVLLFGAWLLLRFARGTWATRDRVALELFLAPVPWFLVFRQRVSNHDHEMLYFAPALAFAGWSVLEDLLARRRGSLRAALVALMLVGTGGAIARDIEHRDDFLEPRALGALVRSLVAFDEAAATSSPEHSVIWEADRFVHYGVKTARELDELVERPRSSLIVPVVFVLPLPVRGTDGELLIALVRRFPCSRKDNALVFDLGNRRSSGQRSR